MPLQEPSTEEEALAMGWTVRVGDDGKKRAFDERTDDQRALLDASYQWDTDPRMSDRPGGVFSAEGPIAFFNRGITRTATLGAGTNWLDKASRAIGINIPEREPEGFIERGAQGAGMAFGSIPAVATIGQNMVLGSGKYIPAIGRAISAPFMRDSRGSRYRRSRLRAGCRNGRGINRSRIWNDGEHSRRSRWRDRSKRVGQCESHR